MANRMQTIWAFSVRACQGAGALTSGATLPLPGAIREPLRFVHTGHGVVGAGFLTRIHWIKIEKGAVFDWILA